jgi:hypothetical protein
MPWNRSIRGALTNVRDCHGLATVSKDKLFRAPCSTARARSPGENTPPPLPTLRQPRPDRNQPLPTDAPPRLYKGTQLQEITRHRRKAVARGHGPSHRIQVPADPLQVARHPFQMPSICHQTSVNLIKTPLNCHFGRKWQVHNHLDAAVWSLGEGNHNPGPVHNHLDAADCNPGMIHNNLDAAKNDPGAVHNHLVAVRRNPGAVHNHLDAAKYDTDEAPNHLDATSCNLEAIHKHPGAVQCTPEARITGSAGRPGGLDSDLVGNYTEPGKDAEPVQGGVNPRVMISEKSNRECTPMGANASAASNRTRIDSFF